jgi:uncharacterized membrane protein YccC
MRQMQVRAVVARMQWRKGLRAAVAVGVPMLVCQKLHHPMGWAALGGLQVTTVDNGGPYRSRLGNMLSVLLPGSLGVLLGTLAGVNLPTALAVTFAFCFVFTLARVLSQPLAATSVFILVCYIVAYGGAEHTLGAGWVWTRDFLLGGVWAAGLALVFWPVDPFGPAREATAGVYAALQELGAALPAVDTAEGHRRFNEILAQMRSRIEAAQAAVADTPARMTARTIRARNLSVLTESADLLLARVLRFAELGTPSPAALEAIDAWLQASLRPVERGLLHRPEQVDVAFGPGGSLAVELQRSAAGLEATLQADAGLTADTRGHLVAALRDSVFNLEVALEAVRAIWTGRESRQREAAAGGAARAGEAQGLSGSWVSGSWMSGSWVWVETFRANLTLRSVMCRHALRLAAVVSIDVVLMRLIDVRLHVTHGYWLAMTSLIVLRPFAGETVRRSTQRVAGTVLGGVLAALLTAVLPSERELVMVIVLGSACAIAVYAVDYAWYCFFLTPTIVLLTLPHLRDWHLALVRTGMTGLGALIAVGAMLLLWPERESLQLPGLLARAAAADAAYLRAMLGFWRTAEGRSRAGRTDAERALLAPARRLCGLAVNDAEDTLDHALLEHDLPLNPQRSRTAHLNSAALTFTTYLRRVTRTTTTLAAVGLEGEQATSAPLVENLATRLERVERILSSQGTDQRLLATDVLVPTIAVELAGSVAGDQLRRLERQVSILERTTAEIAGL